MAQLEQVDVVAGTKGYTPREFAKRVNAHVKTIYRWLEQDGDPNWKPRGRWYIPESAVAIFMGKPAADRSPTILRFRVAADELGVASGDIYELIRGGHLDPQRGPEGWGIPASEVRRLREVKDRIANARPVTIRRVPILGHVSAGAPLLSEEHIDGWVIVSEGSQARFCVVAEGDSMLPGISSGDRLLVEPFHGARSPKQNTVVVALVDGWHTVKRYLREAGRHLLRADNPDRARYPDIPVDEETRWIGRVLSRTREEPII